MKRPISLLIVSILIIASLAACTNAPAATTPPLRTINANGTGEVYLVPDLAYVYVGVRVDADEVSAALNTSNVQAGKVADAVKALGVETKDIQTTNFNVYPMTDYGPDGTITRKYYVVENTIFITVRDLAKLGTLLDSVVRSGANTFNGISFDVSDKDKALSQARDLAIADARAEAEGIASAAGVKLGDLQTVNVSTSGGTVPIYEGKGGGARNAASTVPVSAGQLLITVSANLTYEIK
jgi:uncharacterized protein YggE